MADQKLRMALLVLGGMIMIAHRLATLKNCGRIMFMEDGRIADHGAFSELHARNRTFRKCLGRSIVRIGEEARRT